MHIVFPLVALEGQPQLVRSIFPAAYQLGDHPFTASLMPHALELSPTLTVQVDI